MAALHTRVGADAPVAANRLLSLVSKMFTFAAETGFRGDNPAKGIKRYDETARDRWPDRDKLPRFLKAVDQDVSETARDYIKVLLFTGQRREAVASMHWDELDMGRNVWLLPAEKSKAKRAMDVPLTPAVMDILNRRKAGERFDDERAEYVFPSRTAGADKPWLSDPIPALRRMCKAAGIVGAVRLHDLRRTCSSWAEMYARVPYSVVKFGILGHKLSKRDITGVYTRFAPADVRAGLEATVAAMLARRAGGASDAADGRQTPREGGLRLAGGAGESEAAEGVSNDVAPAERAAVAKVHHQVGGVAGG